MKLILNNQIATLSTDMTYKMNLKAQKPKNSHLNYKLAAYRLTHPRRALALKRKKYKTEGYSFRFAEEKNVLFVHIPKCAGVSINLSLYGTLGAGHATIHDYLFAVGVKSYQNTFKFSVVRNPWDRLVSAYYFLQKGGFGERDDEFFKKNISHFDSFDSFVKNWVTAKNIWIWNHFIPQTHYIENKNNKTTDCDFICFFENLNDDLAKMASLCHNLPKGLRKENAGPSRSYMAEYTQDSIDIVRDVYRNDVKNLGYSFNSSSLQSQIKKRDREFLDHG